MKKAISEVLSKSEIKFWLGVIGIIVSIVITSNTIITKVAVIENQIANLNEKVDEVNDKFTSIHLDNSRQEIAITRIKEILKLN